MFILYAVSMVNVPAMLDYHKVVNVWNRCVLLEGVTGQDCVFFREGSWTMMDLNLTFGFGNASNSSITCCM